MEAERECPGSRLGHDFNAQSGKCRFCRARASWAPIPKSWNPKPTVYRGYTPRKKAGK